MQLAAYPEYKDSGHPFWGKIPAHWNLFRNGRLFAQRNETGFGELPILEVSLKTGVRVRDMDNLRRKQVMSDREKYKRAAQGDIAYNMMRMWQGAIGVAPVDGLVSPAYVVAKPYSEVDCRYFSYLFRTTAYMNEVDAYSRGIVKDRNRLYWQDFKRMPSVVPPIAEQRQIVRFFNDAGGKIQRFIRNKRRLIELLKEQKQNIINQAVTRGIDPNVKLKPSGVEWIGDIPEHWNLCRLRNVVSNVTSGSRGWSQYAADDGPLFIRIANLNRTSLDLRFDNVVRLNLPNTSEIQRTLVQPGDILISITAYIGSIAVAPNDIETAYVSQHVARCSPLSDTINSRWLGYVLLSNVGQFHGQINLYGGTKDGLSLDDVKSYPVLLPPRSEQDAIVKYIQDESQLIDQTITRTDREIELMREYRCRLIADVVTGQADVRGIEVPEIADEELLALEEGSTESEDEIDADEDLKAGE